MRRPLPSKVCTLQRLLVVAVAALFAAAAPVPLILPVAPPLDAALSANLAAMASSPSGANTAAVITCGNVDPVMSPLAGTGYNAVSPHKFQSPTGTRGIMAASWQVTSRTSYCTALLANGCIIDTEERWFRMTNVRSAPFVCVPTGLGSRFVSVLRGPGYVGGVTDLGILVFFGLGTSWNKCGFMQGPFTAMAAAQRHFGTHAAAIRTATLSSGTDLCALDTAGVLHCWETLPSNWPTGAPAWVPGPGDTTRPGSLCMNITGNSTYLKPSPRLCPQFAAAAAIRPNASTAAGCVAPHLLSSFSLSPCNTMIGSTGGDVGPSVVVGVRTDGLPLAWILGADFWDAPPPPGSTGVGPLGLFAASGAPIRVDPRLPPVWRCLDPEGSRMFSGRAADGSGYWEEPEVREQGTATLALTPPRRQLNASAVALLPKPALLAEQWGNSGPIATVFSTACGPFAPFATAMATDHDQQVGGNYYGRAGGGIRAADGSLELPGHDLSHLLPASALQVGHMVMPAGLDFVCISFAPAAPPAEIAPGITLQHTWQVKCAGPPWLSPVIASFQAGASVPGNDALYSVDPIPRCMASAPWALTVSRNNLATAVSSYVNTNNNYNSDASQRVCNTPGCVMFFGYAVTNGDYDRTRFTNLVPRPTVPTATQIKNAEAVALHPGTGGFVCALVRASAGQPLTLYCGAGSGSIPATAADRPPSDGSTPLQLLAVTNTTVCATVQATGKLWCFSDSITALATSASTLFTSSVPAGASAARAVLIDVNVTVLAASESIFCFLHSPGASLGTSLACIGPASDPLLTATISMATSAGYSASTLSLWAGSRGGTVAAASVASVTVGNSHACILDGGMRIWCWGIAASAAAVADANADGGRYARVATGGSSTCAVRVDGRLRCFGGILDSYIQNGQRSTWALANASQAASAAAEPLLPVVLAGLSIAVSNSSGDDSACDFAPAGAEWDVPPLPVEQGGPLPCATLAGAFAAVARRAANSSDSVPAYSIWVNGSIWATPPTVRVTNATTLPLPVTVGLLRVVGMTGTSAAISFADCLSAAFAPTACLCAPTVSVPGLVLESLVLKPARAASASAPLHCKSVIESLVATRLVSVALVGWNCSGSLIAFSTAPSAADIAFSALAAQAAGGSVFRANTPVGAGITAEVAGLAVYDSQAAAAVVAQAMPAVRIAAVTAQGCIFEAVVLVDQALYARVDGVAAAAHMFAAGTNSSSSGSAASVQELLPGVIPCGAAVRINRVSMCEVSGVSVTAGSIRLVSPASAPVPLTGGTVCVSEIMHSAARPAAPAVQAAILSDIRVDDCIIDCGDGGNCGGCAVWASLNLSPDARVSVTGVQATRAAVSGDGAAVYLQVASAQLSNISCVDTFAGGRNGGGCITVDNSNAVAVTEVTATRAVAARSGGAAFMRTTGGEAAASVANSAFSSTLAFGGDGGAVQILASSTVMLSSILCDKSAAPVASGGCIAVKPSRWSVVANGVLKSICQVTALGLTVRSCEAGLRGGGVSVHAGALPDDIIQLRLEGNVFSRNVAGACNLAARLRQWLGDMPVDAAAWWQSGCSLCAAALSQRLGVNGTAGSTCVAPDDAGIGGGGLSLLFSLGASTAAEAAAAAAASSASSNQVDGVCSPVVTLRDTVFEQNAAVAFGSLQGRGGGLFVSRTEEAQILATLTLERVASTGNVAWHGGGGVFMRSARTALSNFSCINCTAVLGDGGGLLAEDTSLRSSQSFVLAHNRALSGRGGGAALTSCILGGLQLLGRSADILAAASATPTATPSPSASGTATTTPTGSRTRTASTSVTPTRSVSSSGTPTRSVSASGTVSPAATATASATPTPVRGVWAPAYDVSAVYASLSQGIVMLNNSAGITGGAIALVACNAVVGGAVVMGNSAPEGGGVSVTGSGSLHLCGSLLQMNLAASRSDVVVSDGAASSYGGALAVVDALKEVHLCNEVACTRYVGLLMRGYDPALLPRWPFPALLSRLVQSASAAMSKLGGPSTSSSGAWPASPALAASRARLRAAGAVLPSAPAGSDVEALWTGLAAAAASSSAQVAGNNGTRPGAGDSATCAWAGNAAEGSGGDVSIRATRSAESVATSGQTLAFLGRSLHYASTAASVGGAIFAQNVPVSMAYLDIAAPMAGDVYSSCTTSGPPLCNVTASSVDGTGVSGGFGGAVGVREATYVEIVAVRVVGAVARFGAGLSLQPFQSGSAAAVVTGSSVASGSASIPVAKAVLIANGQGSWLPSSDTQVAGRLGASSSQVVMVQDGRVLLDGLLIGNSSAATASNGAFVLGQLLARSEFNGISVDTVVALPTLTLDGKPLPAAGGPLPRNSSAMPAGSVPVRMELLRTLPLVQGAVPLVSLVTAPGPVATLRLVDAFNATVEWDDSTGCVASVISSDGAALALAFPSLYSAAAGVVSIQPFAVASAPGSSGMLRLACTVTVGALSYELRADVVRVATASVRLQLDAVAAAPPAHFAPTVSAFCNRSSSAGTGSFDVVRPSPGTVIAHPVLLPVVTGARVWPPDWHVRLTLTDVNGLPIAPPAAIPCTLAVESAVDATSRSAVSASLAAVGAETFTSLLMSGATGTVSIGVSGAANAMVNVTASCRWVSGESVAAFAPLTVQVARLKLAWVLGELVTADGNSSAQCSDWMPSCGSGLGLGGAAASSSSCPLRFAGLAADSGSSAPAAAALGSWTARPAWRLNLTSAAGAADAPDPGRPLPHVLGVEVLEQGAAAASRVLLIAAAPDSSASAASIMPLLDPPQWAADWASSDVAALAPGALPSSLDGIQLLPLLPAPQLAVLAVHPDSSFPLLLGFSAGSGACTASLSPTASGGMLPPQAAVVGRTKASMVDGVVQFSGLGVTGLPLGSSSAGRLSLDCTLGGGEAKLAITLPLRVRGLQATLAAPLPVFVPLSSASTLAALKAPLVYAVAVSSTTAAGGSGAGGAAPFTNVSAALEDASLAVELRSISASVLCALSCITGSGQPCALQGRASSVIDYSAPGPGRRTAAATATFDGLGFSELARFPNETCVSTSCTWLDGQKVLLPTACTALPRPAVHWCSANLSVAACASQPIAVLAASASPALPAIIAINEPLPSFSVSLRTYPADALASLGLDPAAGSLRCVLSAAAYNDAGSSGSIPLGPMQLRGAADVVVDPAVGIATFVGVAIQPTAVQSAAQAAAGRLKASLSVACFMNAQPFGSSAPYTVTLPQLRATWQLPPPTVVLPVTATLATPLAPMVAISLSDTLDPSFVVSAAGSCAVSIVAKWLPPDSIAGGAAAKASVINTTSPAPASAAAFALLTGAAQRPLVDGVAVFPDLAIAGSMGASLTLRAACTRSEGGDVAFSEWNVSVAHAAVAWLAPADPPSLLLTGRSFTFAFAVSWRVFSVADAMLERPWRWAGASSSASAFRTSPVPIGASLPPSLANSTAVSTVPCTLSLDDVTPAAASRPSDVVQYAAAAVFEGYATGSTGSGVGLLNFTVDISGAAQRMANFQPACSIGGHTFRAPARQARLAEVSIVQAVPLPAVWLASDSGAVTQFKPTPQLQLAAEDGLPLGTVGVTCTVSPLGAWGSGAAAQPLFAGIMNRTVQSAAAVAVGGSTTSSVTVAAASGLLSPSERTALVSALPSVAARWPPSMEFSLLNAPSGGYINSLSAASDAPIALNALAVRAGFGDWIALSIECTRPNKDPTVPLTAVMRVARLNAAWLLQPPGESSPGGIFNASLLLYDDSDAQPPSVARQVAAGGSFAYSANGGADVMSNDDVTVCSLVATSLADINGPLDVGAVVLQGGSGRARAGVVQLPSVALTARVGTIVSGRVECATGALVAPAVVLTWRVAISPCPPGSAPAGNGASCVNCGRAYSDGGAGATACKGCPNVGAACSGGVLSLLPGFYRADSNPTVDGSTELFPCWFPAGCWVNATTANRSATATHGCNEGFTGVLCGVCAPGFARTGSNCGRCPPDSLNWLVVFLLPAGFLGFGFWAASRQLKEASPFAPLMRIVLGHVQLLGGSVFVVHSTALVRDILQVAEVAGASPLAMAPIQCALGWNFFARFLATLAVAPFLMLATLGAQAMLALISKCRRKRAHSGVAGAGSGVIALPPSAPLTLRATPAGASTSSSALTANPMLSSPTPGRANFGKVNAASSSAAAGGSVTSVQPRSGCGIKRFLNSPRVVGPAVFVMVRRAVACKQRFRARRRHQHWHRASVGLRCLQLLPLFALSSFAAELCLSNRHHSRLQRFFLHSAAHRRSDLSDAGPDTSLRYTHAPHHAGHRGSGHCAGRCRHPAALCPHAVPSPPPVVYI